MTKKDLKGFSIKFFFAYKGLFVIFEGRGTIIWAFNRVWNVICPSKGLFEEILSRQGPICKFPGTALQILHCQRVLFVKWALLNAFGAFRLVLGFEIGILGLEMSTVH